MLRIFRYFPAMVLPALVYCFIALTGAAGAFGQVSFGIHMPSGETWQVTYGALFLVFALMCFFVEMLRTTSPSSSSIWINALLALAFVPCVIAFVLVRGFATDEFFLICLMMLLDFLLDSAVLVFTARRTVEVSHG